jgi:hypothetical protein
MQDLHTDTDDQKTNASVASEVSTYIFATVTLYLNRKIKTFISQLLETSYSTLQEFINVLLLCGCCYCYCCFSIIIESSQLLKSIVYIYISSPIIYDLQRLEFFICSNQISSSIFILQLQVKWQNFPINQ